MEFPKAFLEDMEEAFDYFKSKQAANSTDAETAKKIAAVPLKKWVANLLRQPVYELIGEKRANVDEQSETKGNEPG